jgi:hypothetical protein
MKSIYITRIISRLFDYTFCFILLTLICLLTPFAIDNYYLYLLALTPLLWVLPQAILLSTWGTTPGYALFSITPRTFEGSKLSFKQALRFALSFRKAMWVPCEKKLSNTIVRIAIAGFILFAALFAKAIVEFPQEFGKEVTERGWVNYTSTDGDFTADFPSEPSTLQKQLEIPQANKTLDYQEVSTMKPDESTYSVSALVLPKKWMIFRSNTILKGALKVLIDNMSNAPELLFKQFTKHGEFPAVDYHIAESGKLSKGRLVLVGQKLFKIECSAPSETLTEEAALTFIQSFKPLTSS